MLKLERVVLEKMKTEKTEKLTECDSTEMVNLVEICPAGVTAMGAFWAGAGTKRKAEMPIS